MLDCAARNAMHTLSRRIDVILRRFASFDVLLEKQAFGRS